MESAGKITVAPLTPELWGDLEQLFGTNGAYAGCWCMWWRLPNKQWTENRGDVNRRSFKELVDSRSIPGLLAHKAGQPAGWISLGPRGSYGRFASLRTQTYGPVDDAPVWSIVCFYIPARFRRQGVATALLHGAVEYARANGAALLEAYPNDVDGKSNANTIYMGVTSTFRAAGFEEVARRHPDRPIMRLNLKS